MGCGQPWGRLAAHDPVWDGEGWGFDRVAFLLWASEAQRCLALAVAIAGRPSPSATQALGSLCDCRLTKR